MPDMVSTWGIPPAVRGILKTRILELRSLLEEDIRRQLAALGIAAAGTGEPPAGHELNTEDERAREVIAAVLRTERGAGKSEEEAVTGYVSETAFTVLNRMVAFRCLEELGLLLIDGQPETLTRMDAARGTSSLVWRVRAANPEAGSRDVARAAYRRACSAISKQLGTLFSPDDDHSVIFPLLATWDRILAILNDSTIPTTTYAEAEILGWVYQYWNTGAKDAIYAKLKRGGKIEEPEELTAASTLYTERYIVDYLLQNTLGALWVEMHPDTTLAASWPYYIRPSVGNQLVTRKPKRVREISLVDPCVGSGHFLVRAFELFHQLYLEEGIEEVAEIPGLILEHNLHGVDIDRRATQIAALALYVKGCVVGGPTFQPRRINLVSCDVALTPAPPDELLAQFAEPELKDIVRGLWDGLSGAQTFGSLLHPERAVNEAFAKVRSRDIGSLWEKDDAEWAKRHQHLVAELQQAFQREAGDSDLGRHLFGAVASRGLDLFQILGRRYDVVVTNPPYAGSRNLAGAITQFIDSAYPLGKSDLYAAFILRCREFVRSDGYLGMVTQQSWMFLRSFTKLREYFLRTSSLMTVVQLGSGSFEEITGAVVNVAAFVASVGPPDPSHSLMGARLGSVASAVSKSTALAALCQDPTHPLRSEALQASLLAVPETPFVFWVTPAILGVLSAPRRFRDKATVHDGMTTGDNDRFVRFFWEVGSPGGWTPYAKAGAYCRWFGLHWYSVNWKNNGAEIKAHPKSYVRNERLYGQSGVTYNLIAQGAMAARVIEGAAFDPSSLFIAAGGEDQSYSLIALLNTHLTSYLLRLTSQSIRFNGGYTENLPLPKCDSWTRPSLAEACVELKRFIINRRPVERYFCDLAMEDNGCNTSRQLLEDVEGDRAIALLHALEGWNERLVCDAYELESRDIRSILNETATPAGWYPLVAGYDALPEAPTGIVIPAELSDFLTSLEHRTFEPVELSAIKARLLRLYEAGPGVTRDDDEPETLSSGDNESEVIGALMPIPNETFLEELSQRLELHPISVYWLLEELREHEGVVSPPLVKRNLEEYVSVSVLRLLGYRWPEQDTFETEHGPILDPTLTDRDGIIPLVACGDQPTAESRVRERLRRDFGDEVAETFLRHFRKYTGRDLADWLRREFFKTHAQQFKGRPIAWHLRSREGAFEAIVLYQRLSRDTLVKLRAEYAGPRIARLKSESARAKERGDDALASDLQIKIEDVEEFRQNIEAIERGAELPDRVRCRWKDETASGRPGPYTPDIDDGVKVNIRPFQENGVLAMTVIKKW